MIKNWELKIKENKSTLIINDWGVKSDDIIDLARHLVIKFHFWALERKGWVYDHFFGEAEDPEDCIVVGNIFDNPQLKKKYGKDWEEEHK